MPLPFPAPTDATRDALEAWGDWSTPRLTVEAVDQVSGMARVVSTTLDDHRSARVLDASGLRDDAERRVAPLAALVDVLTTDHVPRRPAAWILHVGHCGSTALSRLVGELPGCFSVREPQLLAHGVASKRVAGEPGARLSAEQADAVIDLALRMATRTFESTDRAVVKTTSTTNLIVEHLDDDPRVELSITPQRHFAWMLSSLDRRYEARSLAPQRLREIRAQGSGSSLDLVDLSDAAAVALNLAGARFPLDRASGDRLTVDFDAFLSDPAEHLRMCAAHLGVESSDDDITGAIHGGLLGAHSKTGASYSPDDRERQMQTALEAHAHEIELAVQLYEQLVEQRGETTR